MDYIEISVRYLLNEDEQKRLAALLPEWQAYAGGDNSFPFKDWTIKELFQSMMEMGSKYSIDKKLKFEEERQAEVKRARAEEGGASE